MEKNVFDVHPWGQCYKTCLHIIYIFLYQAKVFWKSLPLTNTLINYVQKSFVTLVPGGVEEEVEPDEVALSVVDVEPEGDGAEVEVIRLLLRRVVEVPAVNAGKPY
jgi:hypothetical protein